ncbi:MAG: NifU family protein [Nitrospinaceae bacterium]
MNEKVEKKFAVLDVELTPNPNAFKYVLDAPVIKSGARSITSDDETPGDSFARAVFALGPIQSIYLAENFVTVTFYPHPKLDLLVDAVEEIIESYLNFYELSEPEKEEKKDSILTHLDEIDFPNLPDEEKAAVIDALFDETVRPALAGDGGGLTILGFEDDTLRIRYQGACGSCPSSSTGTLRAIQNILRNHLKEDIRVVSSA